MNSDIEAIPLDKSWLMRVGTLDLIHGYDDIAEFLNREKYLSEDIHALKLAADAWPNKRSIYVGESATLFRFLSFISWQNSLHKDFETSGTLRRRAVTVEPAIINFSQEELLNLDNGTSQWASAKALAGDKERLPNPPYKLALTYEAIDHWQSQRDQNLVWVPRQDPTINQQAATFIDILRGDRPEFEPRQAEDFCFALVFGFISLKEAGQLWPSLIGHESNRLKELPEMVDKAKNGQEVNSRDHRVVQALGMWAITEEMEVKFTYPQAVNKSWPRFWEFVNSYKTY